MRKAQLLVATSVIMFAIPAITGCRTSSSTTSTQATNTITFDQTSTTTTFQNGLRLMLSISATSYHPGDTVSIAIDEINTLAQENDVSAADKWPAQGLALGPCGTFYFPFGLSILEGYFDTLSVASISPLTAFYDANLLYPCAAPPPGISSYNFQASGDTASIVSSSVSPVGPMAMTSSVTSTGFWSGSRPNAVFNNFTPGIYTVVGGDEWGALAILHFTVS